MKKRLVLIWICIRHGINPLGKVAKVTPIMRQRLTDSEKQRFINFGETETERKIWRLWLYEKGGS